MEKGKKSSRRSRSRSNSRSSRSSSDDSNRIKRRVIGRKARSGFSSNFTEQAPSQELKPAQTIDEIRDKYKQA